MSNNASKKPSVSESQRSSRIRRVSGSESEDIGIDCKISRSDAKPDPMTGQYILHITKHITPEHYDRHLAEITVYYHIQNTSSKFFRDDIMIFDTLLGIIDLGNVILEPNKSLYVERKYTLTHDDRNKDFILNNAYVVKKTNILNSAKLNTGDGISGKSKSVGLRTSNIVSITLSRGCPDVELTGKFTSKNGISTGFATTSSDGYVLDPLEDRVYLNITITNKGTAPTHNQHIVFTSIPRGYKDAMTFVAAASTDGSYNRNQQLHVRTINGVQYPTITFKDPINSFMNNHHEVAASVTISFPLYDKSGNKITTVIKGENEGGTTYQDIWKIAPVKNNHIDINREINFSVNLIRTSTTIQVIPTTTLKGPIYLKISPIYDSSKVMLVDCLKEYDNRRVVLRVSILLGIYIFSFKSDNANGIQTAFTNSDVVFMLSGA